MKFSHQKAERIWRTVESIPRGRVASYGLVADLAGLPGRARMVGAAMAQAPESQHLPWYRVLRSTGHIAFPKGSNAAMKQRQLLQEEDVVVINNRVDLKQFGWVPDLGELMALDF